MAKAGKVLYVYKCMECAHRGGRALSPGVSVARLAQEHGVNANLLRKWITKHLMQREAPAVVPQEVRTIDMMKACR